MNPAASRRCRNRLLIGNSFLGLRAGVEKNAPALTAKKTDAVGQACQARPMQIRQSPEPVWLLDAGCHADGALGAGDGSAINGRPSRPLR
jgi:hypothetical protein